MKIDKIWQELESDTSVTNGLILRRYAGSVLPSVFIALKVPEKRRCIAVVVSKTLHLDTESFSNLRDIVFDIIPDNTNPEKQVILIALQNDQHKDVFPVLCEDLILAVEKISTETALIKELFNRFEKWKSLFEMAASQGLSGEAQRGLFGELFLLRKLLEIYNDPSAVLHSWVGPEKAIRDFQSGLWSIEVKTTHGNNHQKLHISSERQLDCSRLQYLFLFHLSLEGRYNSGETLNGIINAIRQFIQSDIRALNRFNSKLLDGGYFDHHKMLYSDTGYFVREEAFYRVHNDFPRIEEQDIRKGVGDVKYSVIVSQVSEYSITETEVLQTIIFYE